jgi:hypothetical protein
MNKANSMAQIKSQIIAALSHPEAGDGLYLRNFANLHEEDERDAVMGDETSIVKALTELIAEGKVSIDESQGEAVFCLV